MFNVGYVFMGISVLNIVINFAAIIVGLGYENGVKVRDNRRRKEMERVIELRL